MVEDIWGLQNELTVNQFLDLTTHVIISFFSRWSVLNLSKIALMILSEAGIVIPLSWKQDEKPKPGHKLTFTRTLQAEAETRLARRVGLPSFIAKIFKHT